MGRRRQQRALEEALARALTVGMERGRQEAFERVLLSTASVTLGREVSDVADMVRQRGVSGALRDAGTAARELWPQRWRAALEGPLSAVMVAATEGAAPVLGSFTLANPVMAEYLASYTSELAGTLSGTSYENFERVLGEIMDEGLSIPDAAARLRERLAELNASRAELIARTETVRASNGASLEQARRSGVVRGKRWLATNDSRTRPEHAAMNGTTVGIDEVFPNGLDAPGEPNCRCTLQYDVDMEALSEARSVA